MIKVLIADDHTMFADGIESILRTEPDIEVVGKCYDGQSIFRALRANPIDVLLLDINLPDMSGIDICHRMTGEFPLTKVIGLTMHNDESFITALIQNGAMGYVLKNTGKTELVDAIKRVAEGKSYFSDEVTQTIMRGLATTAKAKDQAEQNPPPIISRREKEVLSLIVQEYTTTEIADALNISLKTVESHRRSLLTKLNVRNTAGLVRVAVEYDLVHA